jgi:hypothetical protein
VSGEKKKQGKEDWSELVWFLDDAENISRGFEPYLQAKVFLAVCMSSFEIKCPGLLLSREKGEKSKIRVGC